MMFRGAAATTAGWRAVPRIIAKRFASTSFFDSQSGLTLVAPRSAGVRAHELAFAGGSNLGAATCLALLRRVSPASAAIPFQWLAEACDAHRGSPTPLLLAVACSTKDDLTRLTQYAPALPLEAALSVSSGAPGDAVALARAAADAGLRTRCLVHGAGGVGCDATAGPRGALDDTVAALADAGVGVIALAVGADADEDDMREALESAWALDVAGDAMLERVALRTPAQALVRAALGWGATRFEVDARSGCTAHLLAAAQERKLRTGALGHNRGALQELQGASEVRA